MTLYQRELQPTSPTLLKRVVEGVANLLYPPHCMACGVPLEPICNGSICMSCASKVKWIGADRCLRCGDKVGQGRGAVASCPSCEAHPPVYVAASCAVAEYGEPVRSLILGLKFGGGLQAVPLLARLLAQRIRLTKLHEHAGSVALTPVPLHAAEFRQRGFNQAEEIARLTADELGIKAASQLLRKVRRTAPQATLSAEARRENLKDAFDARVQRAETYAKGLVILVDDVMTTGSTAGECAKALRKAGVGEVRGAFLARG